MSRDELIQQIRAKAALDPTVEKYFLTSNLDDIANPFVRRDIEALIRQAGFDPKTLLNNQTTANTGGGVYGAAGAPTAVGGGRDDRTTVNQVSGADPAQTPGNIPSGAVAPSGSPAGTYNPTLSNNGGSWGAGQNLAISTDPTQRGMREVLRAMGLDPDRPGPMGMMLGKQLAPLFASWLQAQSYLNGSGGQDGGVDNMQSIVQNFAKMMTTKGGNAFATLRGAGQKVLGDAGAMGDLQGLSDSDQQRAWLNAMQALLYAGSGDLRANSAADQSQRAFNQYRDWDGGFGNTPRQPNETGLFYDFLNSPHADAKTRGIFGLNPGLSR